MPVWNGYTGGCIWSYFNGGLGQPDWDAYVDHLASFAGEVHAEAETVLVVAYQSESPNAAMRQQVAQFMRQHQEKLALLKGHAMATDSAMSRGALIALNWIFKKPFPERVFPGVSAGLAWLDEISERFDPVAMWVELNRVLPEEAIWRS